MGSNIRNQRLPGVQDPNESWDWRKHEKIKNFYDNDMLFISVLQ
jgi:hypothetical protein